MGKIITGYKGFNQDFSCCGFQYEIGKTYVFGGEPKLCERGFHFCTSPLEVFKYYAPTNRFAIVKADEDDVVYDTSANSHKAVTRRISIVREVTLDEIMRLQMDFSSRMKRSAAGGETRALGCQDIQWKGCSLTISGGFSFVGLHDGYNYSVSVNGGNAATVGTGSEQSVASCYGVSTLAAITGSNSVARADGTCAAAVATQNNSVAIAGVIGAVAVTTDDNSISVGKRKATAICTGFCSVAESKDRNSLAVAAGSYCSASGVLGSWLVLVERIDMQICDVRVVEVDGKDIKEGVRYELVDGKIHEVL